MNRFENEVLRPAVLEWLATVPEIVVHVAPVEILSRAGRRRSSAELGAGTPDLLCSMRWHARGVYGAQWLAFELKSQAGVLSKVQRDEHAAWERAGRWVYVVHTVQQVQDSVQRVRMRLREAGLVPVPVIGCG